MGLMKESLDPHLHPHQFLPDENHPHHANQECEKSINNQLMKGRKRGKKSSSSFLPLLFLLVVILSSSSISSPVSGLSFPSFSFNIHDIFSTNEKESSPVISNPNGVINPEVISHHSIQKRSASRSNSGRNFFGANLQNNRQDLSNAWWRQWWGKFDFFCCS